MIIWNLNAVNDISKEFGVVLGDKFKKIMKQDQTLFQANVIDAIRDEGLKRKHKINTSIKRESSGRNGILKSKFVVNHTMINPVSI